MVDFLGVVVFELEVEFYVYLKMCYFVVGYMVVDVGDFELFDMV